MFKLLDRYIFREWLKAFILSLCLMIGILIFAHIYSILPKLVTYGIRPAQVLQYIGYTIPTYLQDTMPLVFLISIVFSIGTLHRNQEITAAKASGISIGRIGRPLGYVSILLSGVLLLLNTYLAPVCTQKARYLYEAIRSQKTASTDPMVSKSVGFNNYKYERLWFIEGLNIHNKSVSNIHIHQSARALDPAVYIFAKSGTYDTESHSWTFTEGREITSDASGAILTSKTFTQKSFPQIDESPNLIHISNTPIHALSSTEIRALLSYYKGVSGFNAYNYRMRYYQLIANAGLCMIVFIISLPLIVEGVRINPILNTAKVAIVYGLYISILSIIYLSISKLGLHPLFAVGISYCSALGLGLFTWKKELFGYPQA